MAGSNPTNDYDQDEPTPTSIELQMSVASSNTEHPEKRVQSTLAVPNTTSHNTSISLQWRIKNGETDGEYNPGTRFADYYAELKKCADDAEKFDVYQMLAFRHMQRKLKFKVEADEAAKHNIKKGDEAAPVTCGEMIVGIWNFCTSDYFQAIVMVGIIGLLQTFGITLILAEVVLVYFFPEWYDLEDDSSWQCEIGPEDWNEPGEVMYKVLAFLFAIMISVNLGKAIYTIKTGGFNSVLQYDETKGVGLKPEHFYRVKVVDLSLLQLGVLINMYALLLAVFGSFFLIYASEDGEDSLDMVFNALALFFLIELDDLLVEDSDYEDVKAFLNDEKFKKEFWETGKKSDSTSPHCCCCLEHFIACCDWLQWFIKFVVYLAAIVGPFAVFLCW